EQALTRALDRFPAVETVTCDLRADDVDVAADLTSLGFADGSFDWVYCSHVLEHVADDRAAMAELHRVVRPGGTVIVQVPVRDGATYEDPAVTSPADRLAAFGQEDHVRHYGLDVTTRLEDAGFRVGTIRADRLFSRDEIHRHGLIPDDLLFRCDRHD
ncbi:MAG: methyltransferase domain-containing protein, partial [Gemmatimonadetes bacterium]|nr:methyltransferase domain-containing protein [Gemmatimonadota bacterium]NIQ56537.1 methyltransferase domain-containing protein [Gemmatimonadota bacterium]NIU76739.1 methyltransferase domain-containing protein [Gammaproteobacteria bacterium]NIX46145.1 methyltransferase domain-containing protein [Gemmatimonadota bacterium]NIY10462.1 methyltransferase domain-containing protein [Gemmatimonadota bacterium]